MRADMSVSVQAPERTAGQQADCDGSGCPAEDCRLPFVLRVQVESSPVMLDIMPTGWLVALRAQG